MAFQFSTLARNAALDSLETAVGAAPVAGGTLVQTRFDPETENPPELQREGWQAILDNYRKYAERQAAV